MAIEPAQRRWDAKLFIDGSYADARGVSDARSDPHGVAAARADDSAPRG
jgi:hypothetical protein